MIMINTVIWVISYYLIFVFKFYISANKGSASIPIPLEIIISRLLSNYHSLNGGHIHFTLYKRVDKITKIKMVPVLEIIRWKSIVLCCLIFFFLSVIELVITIKYIYRNVFHSSFFNCVGV